MALVQAASREARFRLPLSKENFPDRRDCSASETFKSAPIFGNNPAGIASVIIPTAGCGQCK
jgi:hypothetical protein